MLRLDAELNKDIIIELKKPLGTLYPDFEDAIDEIKASEFLISVGDATFAKCPFDLQFLTWDFS